MCIEANHMLTPDMQKALECAVADEKSPIGQKVLGQLQDNLQIAQEDTIPICQDTGMAVVFLEIGQDVHFEGGSLTDAINEGVRQGYVDGYLRKSVVKDPLIRENTKDNTPAVIHYDLVPGDKVKITVAPKGFGSENMSAIKMFTPAATRDDVVGFIENAGRNFTCCGCWKSYGDPHMARRRFSRYHRCTALYKQCYASGTPITQLIVAA